jgi:transposase
MVDTMEIEKAVRRKRRHSDDFKDELVRACAEPGVSVAGIALANGVNANLLRKWMHARGVAAPNQRQRPTVASVMSEAAHFVPVTFPPSPSALPEIRIEARRGSAVVKVEWPLAAASECAAWLRDWLK